MTERDEQAMKQSINTATAPPPDYSIWFHDCNTAKGEQQVEVFHFYGAFTRRLAELLNYEHIHVAKIEIGNRYAALQWGGRVELP